MASNKIDLQNCSVELTESDIVAFDIYGGVTIDVPKIKEVFDTIHKHFPTAKTILVTAGEKATMEPEAREMVSSGNITEQIVADAIVTKHYSHEMSANFFVRFNQPQRPTKLFKTEAEARDWLKTF